MRRRDLCPMPGHTDEPHQPLLARLDGGLDRTPGAQRDIPLDRIGQIVQLPQIDAVDLHSIK